MAESQKGTSSADPKDKKSLFGIPFIAFYSCIAQVNGFSSHVMETTVIGMKNVYIHFAIHCLVLK